MANKKQAFGEAVTPFTMKGSPHKLGTIEGTEAHKASMAKAFVVEQTRTTADPALVGTELGSSYIPHAIDYDIEAGFKIDSKDKKKKNGEKKKDGEKKEVIIPREEDEIKVEGANEQAYWQSGGGFGEKTFIDPAHKAPKPKPKPESESKGKYFTFSGKKGDKFKYRSRTDKKIHEGGYEFQRPGSDVWETSKTEAGTQAIHDLWIGDEKRDTEITPIQKKSPYKKSGFKMKSSPAKIYNKAGKRRKNYKY